MKTSEFISSLINNKSVMLNAYCLEIIQNLCNSINDENRLKLLANRIFFDSDGISNKAFITMPVISHYLYKIFDEISEDKLKNTPNLKQAISKEILENLEVTGYSLLELRKIIKNKYFKELTGEFSEFLKEIEVKNERQL